MGDAIGGRRGKCRRWCQSSLAVGVYYINASYYFYHCLCELPHGNLIEKYNVLKDMIGASTNSFLVTSSCYGRLQTQTICVLISHVVMNHILLIFG